jgi:alpha-mannosidase
MVNSPRKIKDIISLSFKDVKGINDVSIDGGYQRIPFKFPISLDSTLNIEFKVNFRNNTGNYKKFILVLMSGTAIIRLNNNDEQAIDGGHKLIIINDEYEKEKIINVQILANSRGLFGQNQWAFTLNGIYYGYIDYDNYVYGLYLENIHKIADQNFPEISRKINNEIMAFPYTPNISQIACEEAVSREKYKEYSDTSDFYSYPVFDGKLKDLPGNKCDTVILRDKIDRIIKSSEFNYNIKGRLIFIGHCHIDVAWLWPFSETRKKVVKSFLNVIKLNKMGYNFLFAQSTSLFYEWVEGTEIFNSLSNMIKEGKWLPVGGMYVESDTNLISGESLARQLLYGQRYFLEKFGVKSEIGWLPDSFGFSFQLPQLLKLAGMNIFITHKMKWNDTTDFPYDIFSWKGLDGTEINVSLINNTYNGSMEYTEIIDSWDKFKNKKNSMIYLYGYGDGGGGPTQEMIELMNKFGGYHNDYLEVIKVPGIEDIKQAFSGNMPVYNDELYLEYHRGVYTTNSCIKDKVSKLSDNLVIYDFMDALNYVYNKTSNSTELREFWKTVLRSQFHDVIPGSANRDAYIEAFKELDQVENRMAMNGKEQILLNYSRYSYSGTIVQNGRKVYVNMPAFSLQRVDNGLPDVTSNITVNKLNDRYIINNGYFDLILNKNGTFSVGMNGKTIINNGNSVKVINDVPERFDAWNIDYSELAEPFEVKSSNTEISLVKNNQCVTAIITRKYMNQSYVINKVIIDNSPDINIQNTIYMESKEKLIKSYFEFDQPVKNVKCGIPFGEITRTETMEKFEFPVLGWINCPQDSGIYFISRTIHGYSLMNGTLGISLGRYPIYPDPFTENIIENEYYIHVSVDSSNPILLTSSILKKPLLLNIDPGKIPLNKSLIDVSPENVAVEAIKVAEDGSGIIMRIFETEGKESSVEIKTAFDCELFESDLIETKRRKLDNLMLKPYEIKSILLKSSPP